MDPPSVGGPEPAKPKEPVFGPWGIEYPDGHFDADGAFIPLDKGYKPKVTIQHHSGPVEVSFDEYLTHHQGRPILWQNLPDGVETALGSKNNTALKLMNVSDGGTTRSSSERRQGGFGDQSYVADQLERRWQQEHLGLEEFQNSNESTPPVLTMPDERRASILENTPSIFKYEANNTADSSSPFWEDRQRGVDAVKEHSEMIDEFSEKHGVDPDLVRSIMFMENARGHFYGMNDLADWFGFSDTKMPMNIDPAIWGELLGPDADFNDPAQNIEAATILVGRISDRLQDPTPEAVASIWNYLGRETPLDLGAYVQRVYDSRLWEPQVGP